MRKRENFASAQHGHGSHRPRDVSLYIAVGALIAVLAITLGVYQAKMLGRPGDLLKWVGFSVMTLLVFSWAIREHRSATISSRFWKFLGVFVVIHVVLGVSLLLRTAVTSLFPFVIATPLEYFLLSAVLTRIRFSGKDLQ